ncbi:M61 family metallopeptidase [Pseudoduganella sp. GCM10020061]|uniref:M61 family metallopeptidase n=1 Tax=Pseudoduganella sp. GCM10020061 TaxID=3317345 RepID=UPI00362F7D14
MSRRTLSALALSLSIAFSAHAGVPPAIETSFPGTIVLKVDATNVGQKIFRIQSTIPARPGRMTLLYPEWVPGNHGPSAPLMQLAGLRISAGGKQLDWQRDPVHVHSFSFTVPEGADSIEAQYEYLSPVEPSQGRITMASEMLGVQWLSMSLYPAGYATRGIPVQASLKLPEGWQYGTALETASKDGNEVRFKLTDLETLVDSPVFAGRYFKRIDLDPGARVPVYLNIMADNPESLEAKPEQIAPHREMVKQAYKLFDSYHYKHYDFLFALSDEFGGIGREHHQSSENGVKPGYFSEWSKNEAVRDLLPHEFTHSWNGKFRRPADQEVATFNEPVRNSLLWVYEGQTQYWGNVLAARSGLWSQQSARDALALRAAYYDNVRGRAWRPVQDTVHDPIVAARRPQGWSNYQRSEDYYVEGQLIWLDVDTKIRELSGDKRSLDNFAKIFFGEYNGSIGPSYYTFEDVVQALRTVQEFDWAPFLRERLDARGAGAPLDGLQRAGWKLVYTDTPTDYAKNAEAQSKTADFAYSLGFSVRADGGVSSIVWDGVGFKAGLSGADTIVAVNNRAYSGDVLKAAVKAAKGASAPIELLLKKGPTYRTVKLEYHDGLRYPRLERIKGTPDRLQAIYAPRK